MNNTEYNTDEESSYYNDIYEETSYFDDSDEEKDILSDNETDVNEEVGEEYMTMLDDITSSIEEFNDFILEENDILSYIYDDNILSFKLLPKKFISWMLKNIEYRLYDGEIYNFNDNENEFDIRYNKEESRFHFHIKINYEESKINTRISFVEG